MQEAKWNSTKKTQIQLMKAYGFLVDLSLSHSQDTIEVIDETSSYILYFPKRLEFHDLTSRKVVP